MIRGQSIRVRLSAVFLLFMLLVLALGLFSLDRLGEVNLLSADLRDRWLQTTRVLGDLNNLISDYRAAEGAHLLSATSPGQLANEREVAALDGLIDKAEQSYFDIPHGSAERDAFKRFSQRWSDYRGIAREVIQRSKAGRKADGTELFMTESHAAFTSANDVLAQLTERNVAEAREAGARAAAAYTQARLLIVLAIVVAAGLLIAAVLFVSRTISKPLLDLARRMHRLAANDTAIPNRGIDRNDEIGEMARAVVVFRANAIQLVESQQALAQQASDLQKALAHERDVSTLQRNFVTMASHEFRTPLNIIDGHAQRLVRMKDRVTPEEIAERCGRIRATVVRMVSLIDHLLDSARTHEGEAHLRVELGAVRPAALLRDLCQLHREMAPGVRIEEAFDPLPESIPGDQRLLYQAISNLLSNAVKYSRPGGRIRVTAKVQADTFVMSVEDEGIGIAERDRARLFEPYYRGTNVTGIPGTGLGLHLVKTVVELHQGTIELESAEGRGSRFRLAIPLRGQHGLAVDVAEGGGGI